LFDHVSLRVPDLPAAAATIKSVLDELELEQTADYESFVGWGNLFVMQSNEDRPITERAHVALIAPSQGHVDRFWQAGVDAGLIDDGPAGPRPNYADDYYAAFLKDAAGNSFEAVHRDGERPRGNIDHVAMRVGDVEASTAFYATIADAAGLTIRRQSADRAAFSVGASDGTLLVIAGEPTKNLHIAFSGDDDAARRFHGDAVAAGYRSNGEPGERPRYRPGYYAAFVLDPDGNNIELVSHNS
jgi:catechol 2,3-dioxygenase-like lactoylglutathione lyase family enzyme